MNFRTRIIFMMLGRIKIRQNIKIKMFVFLILLLILCRVHANADIISSFSLPNSDLS